MNISGNLELDLYAKLVDNLTNDLYGVLDDGLDDKVRTEFNWDVGDELDWELENELKQYHGS